MSENIHEEWISVKMLVLKGNIYWGWVECECVASGDGWKCEYMNDRRLNCGDDGMMMNICEGRIMVKIWMFERKNGWQ